MVQGKREHDEADDLSYESSTWLMINQFNKIRPAHHETTRNTFLIYTMIKKMYLTLKLTLMSNNMSEQYGITVQSFRSLI